jgi:hypothetical protein
VDNSSFLWINTAVIKKPRRFVAVESIDTCG